MAKFRLLQAHSSELITGINAPLAMELVLLPEECINKEQLSNSVKLARETIQFVNEISSNKIKKGNYYDFSINKYS